MYQISKYIIADSGARVQKVQDEPGLFCCAREEGSIRRTIERSQKNTEASLKGLLFGQIRKFSFVVVVFQIRKIRRPR